MLQLLSKSYKFWFACPACWVIGVGKYDTICNSHWPTYEVWMQYRSTNPEGWVLLYCMQSEGLVNSYFLAHCFHGYIFSPQELYECLPMQAFTEELYNSKYIMDMNPTRRDSVSHIQYLVYLSNHIATGRKICIIIVLSLTVHYAAQVKLTYLSLWRFLLSLRLLFTLAPTPGTANRLQWIG